MSHFDKVRDFLMELDYSIIKEDKTNGIFIIESVDDGIKNLVIGIAEPILIIEQHLFELANESTEIYKSLLMKNRDMVHGAFVMDDAGKSIIFRDTLQIENLDSNELEGSITSLSMLLSEYSDEIISFSKN